MNQYDFTLILEADFEGPYPTAEEAWMDAIEGILFGRYEGNATPGIRAGEPYVAYSVKAPSMDVALRDAVSFLEKEGHVVRRVEIERDEVPA